MKRHFSMSALALLAPMPIVAISSCATTESGVEPAPVPTRLPGAGEAGDSTSTLDGGCAGDECAVEPVSCDGDWCIVPTGVSSLYALTSVWGTSANDVWAAGSGGTLIHWNGTAWTATPTGVKNTFHALGGGAPNDVWAVSATDMILHFDGSTWTRAPRTTATEWAAAPLFALFCDAAGNVRVGGGATLLEAPNGDLHQGNQYTKTSTDGGIGWAWERGTPTVLGMWGASVDDLWLVGDNSTWVGWQLGVTMHGTRAAGAREHTWTNVDSQSSVVLEAIWGSSAADVWAVGDNGTIRHFVAGATEWAVVASPTREALHAIWGSSASDVWAVGDAGTVLHFDGSTWSAVTASFAAKKRPHLYGVWGSSATDVWIVGDGVALHRRGDR